MPCTSLAASGRHRASRPGDYRNGGSRIFLQTIDAALQPNLSKTLRLKEPYVGIGLIRANRANVCSQLGRQLQGAHAQRWIGSPYPPEKLDA